MLSFKKIAIVDDCIDKWGGIERTLLTLHEMFPTAEFFTSYYDREDAVWADDLKIKTSFIQFLPKIIRGNRIISIPLYSHAFESFDFTEYDLVISVTSSFAKSIITRPDTLHVCYLLTPTRFLWVNPFKYIKNRLARWVISPYITKLREWDFIAAQRPDKIISISQTVAARCKKYYQRETEVVFPPFDLDYWSEIKSKLKNQKSKLQIKNQRYFLVVSRLEQYKRADLVIQSINQLN